MKSIIKMILVTAAVVILGQNNLRADGIDIIPKPQKVEIQSGTFTITAETQIYYSKGLKQQAELLFEAISPATGYDLTIKQGRGGKGDITLTTSSKEKIAEEGYRLNVDRDGVSIVGSTAKGVFYGTQTLLQLLPSEIYSRTRERGQAWTIPAISVEDAPTYQWRGMMLDVSRYFYGKAFVLKYLDMMAMYKMNMLHFHLIDDAGWRLEIKKYPKLTEIGAFRGEDEKKTGGYYTQEDIKEIVAYGEARNIEIIPEIEIPAHTLAAISAYPWLSCREENHVVPTYHFISRDLYCVGKESTFEFLSDVFKETFELFPSKYIHIGGDEAHYDRWAECPHCQARKKAEGLKENKELQVYFTNRVQSMVAEYGKTIVGWDEILERGIKERAVGMIWHDKDKTFTATEEGHDVVMSLTDRAYFDVAESSTPGEIKAATWLKPITLEMAYTYDPMLEGLDEKYRSQVLGASACMWSDQFIHGTILQELPQIDENRSERYFEYLTFPRMIALSEVCWTAESGRDFNDFEDRISSHYKKLDNANFKYRVPEPKLVSKKSSTKDGVDGFSIEIESLVDNATIMYTTDGSYPNPYSSTVYNGGDIFVDQLQNFHAITVVTREHYSLPLLFPTDYSEFKRYGKIVKEWKPSQIAAQGYSDISLNATGKIDKDGKYTITFISTGGDKTLEIAGLKLYKNGKIVTEESSSKSVGPDSNIVSFTLNVDCYETGAGFTIESKLKGVDGNSSNGIIAISKEK